MERKIIFQELPQSLQDDLRDAPIAAIENGIVHVKTNGHYQGQLCQLHLRLKPRSMDANAIIYITQDLQDILVSIMPIQQSLPA